jgi:hypothetical protein
MELLKSAEADDVFIDAKTKVIAKGVAGIRRVENQYFPLKACMALTKLRTAVLMM